MFSKKKALLLLCSLKRAFTPFIRLFPPVPWGGGGWVGFPQSLTRYLIFRNISGQESQMDQR